mmetsp:Transcript_5196/g.18177  ORF Transcript_5196/g.18177 Transcript_5196/m.18177 type:complete len:202 (+) Transcript_5196:1038-1643(+)
MRSKTGSHVRGSRRRPFTETARSRNAKPPCAPSAAARHPFSSRQTLQRVASTSRMSPMSSTTTCRSTLTTTCTASGAPGARASVEQPRHSLRTRTRTSRPTSRSSWSKPTKRCRAFSKTLRAPLGAAVAAVATVVEAATATSDAVAAAAVATNGEVRAGESGATRSHMGTARRRPRRTMTRATATTLSPFEAAGEEGKRVV